LGAVEGACRREEDGRCCCQRQWAWALPEDVSTVPVEGTERRKVAVTECLETAPAVRWDALVVPVRDDEKWWDVGE
jgi:hypothetical protein